MEGIYEFSGDNLAHMQHDEWLATRPKPSAAKLARALAILDRPTCNVPEPDGELPEGYVSIQESPEYAEAMRSKERQWVPTGAGNSAPSLARQPR